MGTTKMRKSILISILLLNSLIVLGQADTSNQKKTVTVEFQFQEKQEKSEFDKYFGYFKDVLGPLVALTGILLTLPILRRKLVENHITTKLNEIQTSNSEIQTFNQKLIDKYVPLTYSNNLLTLQDLENLLTGLQKGFHVSQKASSDVATLMFYLKTTLQGVNKHFDPKNSKLFSTRGLLGFVIDNLDLINFYSTQVVQIPKSSKTKQSNLINKNIRKYVTHSKIVQYRYFKLGIIDDPDSAHFTMFSGKVNRTNHALLMRAAFQIYWNPNAIAKLLFLNKIYAPSKLTKPEKDHLFGIESLDLYLIGFSISNQLSKDPNAPTKVVDLIYSNPDDFHRFVGNLKYDKLKSNFNDDWIPNSDFSLGESISMTKVEIETFRLKYDKNYLMNLFKKNRRKIKKKLKITVPNKG